MSVTKSDERRSQERQIWASEVIWQSQIDSFLQRERHELVEENGEVAKEPHSQKWLQEHIDAHDSSTKVMKQILPEYDIEYRSQLQT